MEPKKYQYIDSLRGIAILLVIIAHVILMTPSAEFIPLQFYYFFVRGIHGVQLFFIVSAFTLTTSYYNRKGESNELKNFFIRRFFRIAPMYYLAIIYFSVLILLHLGSQDSGSSQIPLKGLISSIFFANGLFPAWINSYVPGGWSITVEFMFYCLLPFICRWINNINRSFIFVFVTLLFSSTINTLLEGSSFDKYDFLYYYLPNQLPVFAIGILAYWIVKESVKNINPANILMLAGLILIYSFIFKLEFHIVYSIVFFLLLIVLCHKPYSFFSNSILASIGKCSFSIYLVHFAILEVLKINKINHLIEANDSLTGFLDIFLMFFTLTAVSYAISYFTYKLIEVPGQNLGKKIIKKLNQLKTIS